MKAFAYIVFYNKYTKRGVSLHYRHFIFTITCTLSLLLSSFFYYGYLFIVSVYRNKLLESPHNILQSCNDLNSYLFATITA